MHFEKLRILSENIQDRIAGLKSKHISDRQKILALSVIVGMLAGFGAVIIKNLVHFIRILIEKFSSPNIDFTYIFFPIVGLALTVIFIKYINRNPVRHGIPSVLYAIGKNKGRMKSHNLYSSIISSALTVGFGGSVGLEGPTVATGAAIGSNLGRWLNLGRKQITLLLGCACAGAMSAIFKAPIAAVIFALEVIMLDLTLSAIVPLLISSATGILTSYFFMGQNYLYAFAVNEAFRLNQVGWYIVFGVFTGFCAVYFTKMYNLITETFENMSNVFMRLLVGGLILGFIIFLIPSLFGEGYEVINSSLRGQFGYLFEDTFYSHLRGSYWATLILFLMLFLFKVVATSITFGSGGVGGIFAPSLFSGAIAGLFFSQVLKGSGITVSASNFALVGMAGMIAAVIHAPLTAIFLIAELTGGYQLFLPLIIVATISYATARIFVSNSVYTIQLAKRGELMTHHKDKAVLMMLELADIIESDFNVLAPSDTMGQLIETFRHAHRNIFPVVEKDGNFRGIVKLDDVRHILFDAEMYQNVFVRDLMFMPDFVVLASDPVEEIARKFQESGRYNIVVLEHGKYLGFISRAKLFSKYRELLKDYSEE